MFYFISLVLKIELMFTSLTFLFYIINFGGFHRWPSRDLEWREPPLILSLQVRGSILGCWRWYIGLLMLGVFGPEFDAIDLLGLH